MASQDRPSFDEMSSRPDAQSLAACSRKVREVSTTLEDLAWTLSIRELGRVLSGFAQHLSDDAQRLEMLALLVPSFETLPEDKKDEIRQSYAHKQEEERPR